MPGITNNPFQSPTDPRPEQSRPMSREEMDGLRNVDPGRWEYTRTHRPRVCRKQQKIQRFQEIFHQMGINCMCETRTSVRSMGTETTIHPLCPLHFKEGVSVDVREIAQRIRSGYYTSMMYASANDAQAYINLNRSGQIRPSDVPF